MADYLHITNYAAGGSLALSRRVFAALALEATNQVAGAAVTRGRRKGSIFDLYHPIQVFFRKDGQVELKISISLQAGANANDVCLKIQEEVARALMTYAESVPFKINIKVASIV